MSNSVFKRNHSFVCVFNKSLYHKYTHLRPFKQAKSVTYLQLIREFPAKKISPGKKFAGRGAYSATSPVTRISPTHMPLPPPAHAENETRTYL